MKYLLFNLYLSVCPISIYAKVLRGGEGFLFQADFEQKEPNKCVQDTIKRILIDSISFNSYTLLNFNDMNGESYIELTENQITQAKIFVPNNGSIKNFVIDSLYKEKNGIILECSYGGEENFQKICFLFGYTNGDFYLLKIKRKKYIYHKISISVNENKKRDMLKFKDFTFENFIN